MKFRPTIAIVSIVFAIIALPVVYYTSDSWSIAIAFALVVGIGTYIVQNIKSSRLEKKERSGDL